MVPMVDSPAFRQDSIPNREDNRVASRSGGFTKFAIWPAIYRHSSGPRSALALFEGFSNSLMGSFGNREFSAKSKQNFRTLS